MTTTNPSVLDRLTGFAAVAISLMGLAPDTQSATTVVIADTFALAAPHRLAGTALAGTVTETGGRTWVTAGGETRSPVFAAGGVVTGSTAAAYSALVPLGFSGSLVSLQADLIPGGTPWAGVVFNHAAGSMWYDSLLLTLDNDRHYVLFADGVATRVAGGTAPASCLPTPAS